MHKIGSHCMTSRAKRQWIASFFIAAFRRSGRYMRPVCPAKPPALTSVFLLGEFMASGSVKWFNEAKGYGFITPDEGEDELFAHYSAIQMSGYKTLKEGQRVSFEVIKGDKGKQATNIQPSA
jgi:CspA family cold shock protein